MTLSLYPDQSQTVDDVRAAMKRSKSVLLVSPTGSGKTQMATHIIEAAKNKQNKIVFTVPRKDLLEQTSETFRKLDIPHSYIAAGKPHNPFSKVYIGMIDTMARRADKLPDAALLIVDEAHHGQNAMDAVVDRYKRSGSWLLGLSATPWKLSGKGLGCWYDTMVEGKSIKWLIENKRLSDYDLFYGVTRLDYSGVKRAAGDFARGEISDFMLAQRQVIGDCVRDYKLRCMGKLHIVRCASIKNSQIVAENFRLAGIPAMHVDGDTPMDERKRVFKAFARRELLVLCFVDLLGMGIDLAQITGMDVCIESCSDLNPSLSLAKQMQFWGRVLRYKLYRAIINDHVNNYIEHGLPCAEREWTLEDREQGTKGGGERAMPVKQCDRCFFVSRPSPQCPNCGNIHPIKSREVDEVDGELQMADKNYIPKKLEQGMARDLDALIALGKKRNMQYPHKWAAHVMSARNAKRLIK